VGRPDLAAERRRLSTAHALHLDVLAGEVTSALSGAGLSPVLLKGASLVSWLYRDGGSRPYIDVDVWIAPHEFDASEAVLSERGFVALLGEASPLEQVDHARMWERGLDHVDLHRTFVGIGATPGRAWEALTEQTVTLSVGGVPVQVLAIPARALFVALHAAVSGPQKPTPLADLARALQLTPFATWQDAAELARRVDAVPAFAAGLRLDPDGAQLAGRLALSSAAPLLVALRAASAPPLAVGLAKVARAQGVGAKLHVAARKLIPTPAVMRVRSRLARRGPAGLALAYGLRPVILAWRLPAALTAILRAVSSGRS
jgi:hypothetical protein